MKGRLVLISFIILAIGGFLLGIFFRITDINGGKTILIIAILFMFISFLLRFKNRI